MIVAIDPGLQGAICFWYGGAAVLDIVDMPVLTLKRGHEIDADVLADLLESRRADHAFFEDAWSRPENGAAAAHKSGKGHGIIIGILAALRIPRTLVTPQRWKKALAVPAEKDGARARASELLPSAAHYWRLKKHDGRAESALIALWGAQFGIVKGIAA